jgi:hypothetical protein
VARRIIDRGGVYALALEANQAALLADAEGRLAGATP